MVALLVLLSGCLGAVTSDPDETERTTARESIQKATNVSQTTSTLGTTTLTTAESRANVVEFRTLDPEAKRIFERALENGSLRGVTGLDSEAIRPLFVNDYVEYRDELYPVRADRQLTPRYVLVNVTEIDDSEIENRTRLSNYSELDAEAKTSFEQLLTDGSSISYPPSAYPFPGTPTDDSATYVRYRGSYYELEVAQGDVWAYRFTVGDPSE